MKVLEAEFKRVLEEHPERCRVIKSYSKNRKWAQAFASHGEALGMSYDEIKALGCWLIGSEPMVKE